jgi:hypothetical protein
MPTGYTAAIKDGITFEQYALSCARAFGALIDMKEAPPDTPIPEKFEVSDYHKEKILQDKTRLADIASMSDAQYDTESEREWQEQERHRLLQLAENQKLRRQYETMLEQVENYKSPSSDHDEYKNFMRNQILDSIKFDCSEKYYSTPTPKLSGADWASKQITELRKTIKYHEREYEKEVERTDNRNNWVRLLRESLK